MVDHNAMIHTNRYVRLVLAGCGLLLLGVGLAAAYSWFYRMAPMRHLADPEWLATHSEAARWAEEQRDYQRLGSSPDLCFRGDRIGFYGDKEWFLWLEEQIRNPEFRHCGCTEDALALMTNQHTTAWDQWTDANRARSQEEWIRDGFLRYGINVHLPPERDDTVPLLRLLGRKSWDFLWNGPQDADEQKAIPSYVHYNAYRWLRDSGFKPLEFTSSNPSLAADSEVSQGLLTFAEWRAAYPGRDGLGVLALGPQSAKGKDATLRPLIAEPWLVVAVDAFIGVFTIGGGILFVWGIKRVTGTKPTEKIVPGNGQVDRNEDRASALPDVTIERTDNGPWTDNGP